MIRNKLALTSLTLLFLFAGCEKDTDLLCDYVCFDNVQKSKVYELSIGNRVTYKDIKSGKLLNTDPNGSILFKGIDTKTIKPGGGLESLSRNLDVTLSGKYTVVESNGLEDIEITKNVSLKSSTDKDGKFFFKITHATTPGMIISKVTDIDLNMGTNVSGSNVSSSFKFSGDSIWSKAIGYFGALATYNLSHGTYACTADKCTWIDLGADLTLQK